MDSKFEKYLNNELTENEKAEFEEALENDAELRANYEKFVMQINIENLINQEEHSLSESFTAKVMNRVDSLEIGFFKRLYMYLTKNQKIIFSTAATCGVLVLVVKLAVDAPDEMLTLSKSPVVKELENKKSVVPDSSKITVAPTAIPTSQAILPLTPGHRAVSISMPNDNSLDKNIKPGSRVDVTLTYKDQNGQLITKVITENARVMSAGGAPNTDPSNNTAKGQSSSITFGLPPAEALKIQTARELGEINVIRRPLEDSVPVASKNGIDNYKNQHTGTKTGKVKIGDRNFILHEDGRMTGIDPKTRKSVEIAKPLENSAAQEPIRMGRFNTPGRGTYGIRDGRLTEFNRKSDKIAGATADFPAEADTIHRHQAYRWNMPYPPQTISELYAEYDEGQRILVNDEAKSTFSIDVDTGSYTNARRFIMTGKLPPANSVRIEEFINYFKYNYPVEYDKPFSLNYEIAPAPLEPERFLLKLGIKARDARASEKPWNLVFLIDVSGSMSAPNKLELVKSSLRLLVNQMKTGDKIAIVTYAGHSGLVLDSSTLNRKAEILNAINTLRSGGSTHGSSGINLAYQVAERSRIPGGVNRVVLATDGDFNVGVTSHTELIKLIEEKRRSGTTLTTLGFGTGNIKESTMEQLANKGNGNYFYIDSYKEARKVLETDLMGTMEVVAKDVKLQIEFNPEHVKEYRLIGYDNRRLRKQDFNNDRIDAGEIGSSHTVTALYELVLTNSELARNLSTEYRYKTEQPKKKPVLESNFKSELAFLKIRYKKPEGTKSTLIEYPILSKKVLSDSNQASPDFRFAAAVSYFGHLLRNSQFAGNYSFSDIEELAKGSAAKDEHGYRQEFIELVRMAKSISR